MPGQLVMRRTHYRDLPEIELPEGYRLRTFRPGDEVTWARIINSVGNLGHWDVERVRRDLTGQDRFDPEGLFFVETNGVAVATACAWPEPSREKAKAQLHMVAVDPAHQGKRLGKAVSLAVIRYFEAHGYESVYLLTDDFRLAAVKTYLDLGFEPQFPEEDHIERWRKLYAILGYEDRTPSTE